MKNKKKNEQQPEATDENPSAANEATATENEEIVSEVTPETETPLDVATRERDEFEDRLKRTMAEYQNFRRQSERRRVDDRRIIAKDILQALLPVVDGFDAAMNAAKQEGADSANILQGMEMIRQLLEKYLGDQNVTRIESNEGQHFDPELHNAVAVHATDEIDPNLILSVVQPGYRMNDMMLRHAMVCVSQTPAKDEGSEEADHASADDTTPSATADDKKEV